MFTWQSTTSSNSQYFLGISKPKKPQVTFFHNSQYIQSLNKQLRLELGTLEVYSRCFKHQTRTEKVMENHRESGRLLRNLIILNRGIPDCDGIAMPAELSLLAGKLGLQLGSTFGQATSIKLAIRLEHLLRRRYISLLESAPRKDRIHLEELLYIAKANQIALANIEE